MPIGIGEGAARAIALEGAAIEREIELLARQRQAIAASNDRTTAVPQRFRLAVTQARARLDQAEASRQLADTNARLKIQRERPSESLARVWYEADTLAASNEHERAREALASAELALGQQVEYRRELERLEASAPAARAEAERAYQQALARIEMELTAARFRCAID